MNARLQNVLRGEALLSLHLETVGIDLEELVGFDSDSPETPDSLKDAVRRAMGLARFDVERPCDNRLSNGSEP